MPSTECLLNPSSLTLRFAPRHQKFENYVTEIKFFRESSGASRKNAYWVLNVGRARVDVGIASLPLLHETEGRMVVADWGRTCYDTLLQFYDVEGMVGDTAVLKPKGREELGEVEEGGVYDWCFSFKKNTKTVRVKGGPTDTGWSMKAFSEHVSGCNDMGQTFYCNQDSESGRVENCLSCFDVLMAITKRGRWVEEGLKKVREVGEEGGGEGGGDFKQELVSLMREKKRSHNYRKRSMSVSSSSCSLLQFSGVPGNR